jgi:hypothetical protein
LFFNANVFFLRRVVVGLFGDCIQYILVVEAVVEGLLHQVLAAIVLEVARLAHVVVALAAGVGSLSD